VTPEDFRRVASGLKDALENAHMGHPDFRTNNRIFATLHADGRHGMVKLQPDQQLELIRAHPDVFTPASGAWGRGGSTMVLLDAVDETTLGEALTLAWQNARQGPAKARTGKTRKP
jgi:hypothetical protein